MWPQSFSLPLVAEDGIGCNAYPSSIWSTKAVDESGTDRWNQAISWSGIRFCSNESIFSKCHTRQRNSTMPSHPKITPSLAGNKLTMSCISWSSLPLVYATLPTCYPLWQIQDNQYAMNQKQCPSNPFSSILLSLVPLLFVTLPQNIHNTFVIPFVFQCL